MELYTKVAYAVSRQVTLDYSTSFSSSTRLFAKDMRPHIYAIYGLVRIADEVVDTYRGKDTRPVLDDLEREVYTSITRQYSANPVVHAFSVTAATYGISRDLIKPFFDSMRMDINPSDYSDEKYEAYIYGSAEVVGLMCLRVFMGGDEVKYQSLEAGARALGSAYQKVNFLRDMAADYTELGRIYFPGIEFENFNEQQKNQIIQDIEADFRKAKPAIDSLPVGSQTPVKMSYVYYTALLKKLRATSVDDIKQTRVRIKTFNKAWLLLATVLTEKISGK